MNHLLYKPRIIFTIYTIITIIATLHLISLGYVTFGGIQATSYNNYFIYTQSFFHLLHNQNLYIEYSGAYWDLYKYTPTFALFMGLFAYLPIPFGVVLWNLLNFWVMYTGIRSLSLPTKANALIYGFILFEFITSIQAVQCNVLMAGLLLHTFTSFEKKQLFKAALFLICATFIKGYGAIGFLIFIFYPQKGRFLLYSFLLFIVFTLLPLYVTDKLLWQYQNWFAMMLTDYNTSYGLSFVGVLYAWFHIDAKIAITAIGIFILLVPLTLTYQYSNRQYRLHYLAFLMVWMLVFNHKAESPTYIIATLGIAIWYFTLPKVHVWQTCMVVSVFIFTTLSHTDIFPPFIRYSFIYPYYIKAVPCIIASIALHYNIILTPVKENSEAGLTLSNL
jgi:hypothetical protein